jgi:hypothetical protein
LFRCESKIGAGLESIRKLARCVLSQEIRGAADRFADGSTTAPTHMEFKQSPKNADVADLMKLMGHQSCQHNLNG